MLLTLVLVLTMQSIVERAWDGILARRLVLAVLASLCTACATLALSAAPASATVSQFGSEGVGAGQVNEPSGVAVDQASGDVYVVDKNNERVDEFSSEGAFLLAWGWGVANGKAEFETCGPVASLAKKCRAGLSGGGAGQLASPEGIAVNNDPFSASHGYVYVEDAGNHRVQKFTADGEFRLAWGEGVADGKEEAQTCGPEAAIHTCQASVEPPVEGTGEGPGEFERMAHAAIALDSEGTVYVGDTGRVQEFSEGGAFKSQVTLTGLGFIEALAVDPSKDIYVMSGEGVRKFNSSGTELGTPRDPAASAFVSVITVGPAGELFMDDPEARRLVEFGAEGEELASFDASAVEEGASGLAFGEGIDRLYVLHATRVQLVGVPAAGPLVQSEEAIAEPVGTATVRASIDPEGEQTEYHLDYGLEEAHETATAAVTMAAEEFEPETVAVKLKGLRPGATYHFHFVASNASAPGGNSGSEETFATLPAVGIESESASQVTAASARLATVIDPLTLPSEYHFEYGSEDCASAVHECVKAPVPDASVGSGDTGVPESVLVEGLTAGTTYHYRVVAHNNCNPAAPAEVCVVEGADRTFTTQGVGGSINRSGLIDGRGWELVSPPEKHGAALDALTLEGGDIQAAEDGSGLAYVAKAPVGADPEGNRSLAETQLLATHAGAGGSSAWSTRDIATRHEAIAGLTGGELSEYRLFSPDLATAAVEPTGSTPLSESASERTPYRREADGEYVPLVSGCPPVAEPCPPGVKEHEDVPAGTKFGASEPGGALAPNTGVRFVSASEDLAHIVLSAPQALSAGFETEGNPALYEWTKSSAAQTAGELQPVSILPDKASAAVEAGASLGDRDLGVRHAISADGNRVFFENEEFNDHLYVRDMHLEKTVQLDVPEEGAGGGEGAAVYQDANAEGTRAFFTDPARLTENATSKPERPDLYMCEVGAVAAGEHDCSHHLTDLTPDALPGEAADVLGVTIGSSVDGSYMYFVANGVLSNAGVPVAGAVHGDCRNESAAARLCNLYVFHDGAIRLVAVLSNRDFPDWEASLSKLPARVSPNGRFLAFMSQQSLTGYDNHDAKSGEPDEEVFEYDAATQHLVCASCDPSGARPEGILDPGSVLEPPVLVDVPRTWGYRWLAGSIPGATNIEVEHALYQSRYLSNEGRLFFNSPVALVPGDGNEREDVYEFEPEGVGPQNAPCGPAATGEEKVFKPARAFQVQSAEGGQPVAGEEPAGCVGLISSGTSGEESAFLDASASGGDVFFLTAAKLSPGDVDNALDVYDAHVCGAGWACPPAAVTVPPACTTADSCRAAPAPQPEVFGAPASATFSGPGNPVPPAVAKKKTAAQIRAEKLAKALKACTKKPKSKRSSCVRHARKQYGATAKAKRAITHPRRGR